MDGLKAILTTMGIVIAALGIAFIVLIVVWIIGSYGVDRSISISTIGVLLTAVGIVVMVVFYFRPWRRDDDARSGRRRRRNRRRMH